MQNPIATHFPSAPHPTDLSTPPVAAISAFASRTLPPTIGALGQDIPPAPSKTRLRHISRCIAAAFAFLILCNPENALSADYWKGLEAYKQGNHAIALQEWLPLAEQGNTNAQTSLGFMYVTGEGVARNYKEAAKWFSLAAQQGDAYAQNELGLMYEQGEGVPQNYETAAQYYRSAADQGFAEAQNNLGIMYADGKGVPQDHEEAARYYRLAAEQNLAPAQFNLGSMYYDGHGVTQDHPTALQYYRLAAQQGDAFAQHNLAVMYANGEGVAQDYVAAYIWFDIAASSGYETAATSRDKIAANMSQADIAKAHTLARQCIAQEYKDC